MKSHPGAGAGPAKKRIASGGANAMPAEQLGMTDYASVSKQPGLVK